MSNFVTSNSGPLRGTIKVPGDKSISHRSIMLGSIADGVTRVSGFLEGEDSLATLNALKKWELRLKEMAPVLLFMVLV
jgi:3-phosphoshikimate 1-carboxyvinyltransferase